MPSPSPLAERSPRGGSLLEDASPALGVPTGSERSPGTGGSRKRGQERHGTGPRAAVTRLMLLIVKSPPGRRGVAGKVTMGKTGDRVRWERDCFYLIGKMEAPEEGFYRTWATI